MGPEAINQEGTDFVSFHIPPMFFKALGYSHSRRCIMGKEDPVSNNTLQEDIMKSEDDCLRINMNLQR
jgi:hypothetical protein